MTLKIDLRTAAICVAALLSAASTQAKVQLDDLAISVSAEENRAVSFTNKESAYYYTQTQRNDHPEHAWFRGLNIAGRRVFNDYQLLVDGKALDPATAKAVVKADALIRSYPGGVSETLRLFDGRDVVGVELTGTRGKSELRLSGDQVKPAGSGQGIDWYVSSQDGARQAADYIAVGRRDDRFLIAVGASREAAGKLLDEAKANEKAWSDQRHARLEGLISGDRHLATDDARLTQALRWITLTTDELVTRQRGDGIYAGLPWFNEYWGRDSFISLTGATLVTGQFATARNVLKSFAQFQDLDRDSPHYGRMPNNVKPGSIDYHTTDGTPRYMIALRDYVRYSGDRSIVNELYPNIVAGVEGALAHWVDASGYLLHKDNETWMDARRNPDLAAYSPRATRANDIQALWHQQLLASAEFAGIQGDADAQGRWTQAAARIRANFSRDFVDPASALIADHVSADNKPDFTLRPNALFTLELLADDALAARATRKAWQSLVYPWGVSTLDQNDAFFHPYHLAPGIYHKDEAYHNGTVWPWLNGIAMQRMIEYGQVELAWPLFQFTNELALSRGVVGGVAETMDAYPHPGEAQPRLTGTFLQAWSNAEQLRVWYQHVLGVRPDMAKGEIVLAPRLPASLGTVDFTVRAGNGTLGATFDRVAGNRRYVYRLAGQPAKLVVDISPFEIGNFDASPGDTVTVEVGSAGVRVRVRSDQDTEKSDVLLPLSTERQTRQAGLDAVLAGASFATPKPLESHKVLQPASAAAHPGD